MGMDLDDLLRSAMRDGFATTGGPSSTRTSTRSDSSGRSSSGRPGSAQHPFGDPHDLGGFGSLFGNMGGDLGNMFREPPRANKRTPECGSDPADSVSGELRLGCEFKWRVRWLVVGRSWADVKKDAPLTYECPWSLGGGGLGSSTALLRSTPFGDWLVHQSGRGHIVDSLAYGEAHAVESNFSMLPCKLAGEVRLGPVAQR
ncbi:hypothetical protein FOZ63_033825, partial [Perkinsus olseni]